LPELPEVETVRRGLEDRLSLFCIEGVEVFRERAIASPGGSEEFTQKLVGAFIGKWNRRGKYLIASLHKRKSACLKEEDPSKVYGWLGVHLRMTGYFQWHDQLITPCPYTRVRFWNNHGAELRFVDIRSFGQMWWVPSNSSPEKIITGLTKLGPEPFSKEFNCQYLTRQLKGKTCSIKAALLNQSLVAGVGNIYADESLFLAGILPQKASCQLKPLEIKKLRESLIEVLKVSIGKGGTTFSDFRDLEGLNGNYGGQAWVYKRGGQICRKCGSKINRAKVSGRSTHWCPECQKDKPGL
tara:strand:- start:182 stop:1072 length:891 start_codon:yes stop_codon:yes gene_type:complete